MAIPDAQGTTISFAGVVVGGCLRFGATPSTCDPEDVSTMASPVVGSGNYSSVVRQFNPGAIKPGTASVEIIGSPNALDAFGPRVIGKLSIRGPWGGVSWDAYISKFTVGGSVGDLVRATLEFQFV